MTFSSVLRLKDVSYFGLYNKGPNRKDPYKPFVFSSTDEVL